MCGGAFGPLNALHQPQNNDYFEYDDSVVSVRSMGHCCLLQQVSSTRKSLIRFFLVLSDTRCALYFKPYCNFCSSADSCQIRWEETRSLSASICSLLWLINRIVKFILVPAGRCFWQRYEVSEEQVGYQEWFHSNHTETLTVMWWTIILNVEQHGWWNRRATTTVERLHITWFMFSIQWHQASVKAEFSDNISGLILTNLWEMMHLHSLSQSLKVRLTVLLERSIFFNVAFLWIN